MPLAEPAIQLRNLTRRFGPIIACNEVNLQVQLGSIHGLIGENGAGKSTAMKLLYGMYRPDAGEIWVHGKQRHWASPANAIAAGIGMVHQHFMLAGPHSVLDNILIGAEPVLWGCIARSRARNELDSLAQRYGLAVDLEKPVESLGWKFAWMKNVVGEKFAYNAQTYLPRMKNATIRAWDRTMFEVEKLAA